MEKSSLLIALFSFLIILSIIGFFLLNIPFWQVIILHFLLFCVSIYFLYDKDILTTLKNIGILDVKLATIIYYTLIGIISIFLVSLVLGTLLNFLKINDQEKVISKVNTFPLYIVLFAIFFAPVSEELFFRAFLSSKTGNFLSTIIFALFHLLYGSVTEIIGVFFIGYILATIYKRSLTIWPCILIHALFNLFSISLIKVIS